MNVWLTSLILFKLGLGVKSLSNIRPKSLICTYEGDIYSGKNEVMAFIESQPTNSYIVEFAYRLVATKEKIFSQNTYFLITRCPKKTILKDMCDYLAKKHFLGHTVHNNISNFLLGNQNRGKMFAIDGSKERYISTFGRNINHSRRHANVKPLLKFEVWF